MTIQWLAKRVVPDFNIRIYSHPKDGKTALIEEEKAGSIASSTDKFYQVELQDFTFYHKYLRIDV